MDVYHLTFAVFLVICCWSAWYRHRQQSRALPVKEAVNGSLLESHGDPRKFRKIFLTVYLLVMGSDWLQVQYYLFSYRSGTLLTMLKGAYVYTLYKDEKNLAETVVADLFTCGFLAAAISALFVGSLADRYGRRLACLVFCVTYAIGCLTKISNDVTILFIGRLLGGLSTTLMFSVFESWMVTEYLAQGLDKSSITLDSMFGVMSTLNSIVAIFSGVVEEGLVAATGTKVSLFMAAVVCLSLAFVLMIKYWVSESDSQLDASRVFKEY
jgi:MFS family permease